MDGQKFSSWRETPVTFKFRVATGDAQLGAVRISWNRVATNNPSAVRRYRFPMLPLRANMGPAGPVMQSPRSRVWPMINSHIMEGLSYWAERGHKKAAKLNTELIKKTVAMLSGEIEGLALPVSCEHYSPVNGRASRYRGVDNYLHSFALDNIFRVACGFVVRFGEVQVDPVTDDMPGFKITGVPVGNKRFTVEKKGAKHRVTPE